MPPQRPGSARPPNLLGSRPSFDPARPDPYTSNPTGSRFDPARPFAWANTPSKLAVLIKQMGSVDPVHRPPALDLIDRFWETRVAGADTRGVAGGGCCAVS